MDKDGKVNPSWEIFFNEKLTFKEKPTIVIKEVQEEVDWVDYMDAEAMGAMLKAERDILAITIEEPSDPFAFKCLLLGNLIIGLRLGFLRIWEMSFVMQV